MFDTRPKWLTSPEAADYLEISTDTLFRLRAAGHLVARQYPGSHPRYRLTDLEEFRAAADAAAAGRSGKGGASDA